MKIIGLSYGDPWKPFTWSNNPYYLFSHLQKKGLLEFAWGETPQRLKLQAAKIKAALRFRTLSKTDISYLASRYFISHQLNNLFQKKLTGVKKNSNKVILSTSSLVHFKNLQLPLYLYGDQSFYQYYQQYPSARESVSPRIATKLVDYEKKQGEKSDGILCFSKWMKDSLVSDYHIDEKKVHVVGHGYCLPEIDDFEKKVVEEPVILFVSTHWKNKGGDIVLKAYQLVKEQYKDIRIHIVGRMPPEIHEQFKNEIVFHGFLQKDKPNKLLRLIDLYKKAAVFVLPSIYDPMPNITLEANYLKTPVITSNVCGIPEQVIDNETGYIISDNNPGSYAEKILNLLNNAATRYRMGESARSFVEQNFSWHSTVNKMINIIKNS